MKRVWIQRSQAARHCRRALACGVAVMLTAALASCGGGSGGGDAEGKPSRIVLLSYGGPWDDLTQKYVADPFTEETGIEVVIRPGSDELINQVLAQKERPQYDLILTGYEDQVFLDRGGALDRIVADDIPNATDLYPIATAETGVATSITGVSILYNTEKIPNAPTSWSDLWDPQFKGRVAIPKLPQTYGIDFLMMAARQGGGSEENIDPGFAELERLKPNVGAAYDSSGQAAQLLQQGSIWIMPWYSGRVSSMREAGIPIAKAELKEGDPVYLTMLSPLKGKYNEWTAKFLDMYLSEETQQAFADEFDAGPSRSSVKLSDEVAADVPYGQEEVDSLIQFDWNTILENRDEWTERFNRLFS